MIWSPNFFTIMNDDVDELLDSLLSNLIENKTIIDVKDEDYYLYIEFSNGVIANMWNANRYYAWLCIGTISENNSVIYKWNYARPRKKTMRKLRKKLRDFYKNKYNEK